MSANKEIFIFDNKLKKCQRERAAKLIDGSDFLISEIAERIAEKFDDEIKGKFPLVLEIGGRNNALSKKLKGKAGIEKITESAETFDEQALQFPGESFDLILCNLNLHWVNDLPGALVQIKRALKKDGLFIATIFGGETLKELKQAMAEAELSEHGGISPRISPFVEIKDAGALLQRAGFALPVSDSERITVMYDDIYQLIKDLRAMGETNATINRKKTFVGKTFFEAVSNNYRKSFSAEEGKIPATFEVITMTGWKN